MKKEIIISGGLGNQMFEYAFYLSLKERGINCVLNTSLYDTVGMHNGYELSRVFGLNDAVKSSKVKSYITRLLCKYRPAFLFFKEEPYILNESVYTSRALYYWGTWISDKYFDRIEGKIRNLFLFRNIDTLNQNVANQMRMNNSVSIHIRRGDYLNFPTLNVCNEQYYDRSITFIKTKVNMPVFYVFSDDTKWADSFMKRFDVNYKIIDFNKGADSYKDMYLMSQCKHNINANSTFSWWGAWLNTNPCKIVIVPKKWTKTTNEHTACINWIKL